jgi:hypothetical protein
VHHSEITSEAILGGAMAAPAAAFNQPIGDGVLERGLLAPLAE